MATAQQIHVVRAVCVDRESTPVETGVGGSGGVGKKKKEQHKKDSKRKNANNIKIHKSPNYKIYSISNNYKI